MLKITNTQPGPRGVNAVGGPILVEAGQTVEAKVYQREKDGLDASGWFTIEGSYETDPSTTTSVAAAAPATDDGKSAARIAELEGQVKERDATIADLRKQLPETDPDKMTVPELRAFLAFHDQPYDGAKDKKPDLLEKAKKVTV